MEHKMLRAGDVRQEGDEQSYSSHTGTWDQNIEIKWSPWQPVSLIGEPILRSDLMHLQFRRPL